MRLVCFGTGACSRVGQLKDEEQLEEVSDGAPISFDRTKNEPVADANGNPSRQQHTKRKHAPWHGREPQEPKVPQEQPRQTGHTGHTGHAEPQRQEAFRSEPEKDQVRGMQTRGMVCKPAMTVLSVDRKAAPSSSATPTVHHSLNDDLYLFFSDSEDDAGMDARVDVNAKNVLRPHGIQDEARHASVLPGKLQERRVHGPGEAQDDEESDDLLQGLGDPF